VEGLIPKSVDRDRFKDNVSASGKNEEKHENIILYFPYRAI
jgi:hypothetical protein